MVMDKVIHFEIPFDDEERASKFYQEVFGWRIDRIPEMNYSMVTTVATDQKMTPKEPGAINGGLMKRDSEHAGEHPVIVIDVKSIDEYIKKVEGAGGKVVMPKLQVGDMGLYARVEDTEGNVIGIWQTRKK